MNNVNVVKELLSYPEREGVYTKVFASYVARNDGIVPTLLCTDHRALADPFRVLVEHVSVAAREEAPGQNVKLVFDQRLSAQNGTQPSFVKRSQQN